MSRKKEQKTMHEIVDDFSLPVLLRAMETNIQEAWIRLGRGLGAEIHDEPKLLWFLSGIYNVATLPEARRQGIGRALTLAPLLEARSWGYRTAILQATPMGINIYRRMGFREYCTFHVYFRSGE